MPKGNRGKATNGPGDGASLTDDHPGRHTRSLANLRERIGLVRGIDEETRTVTGYASTGSKDRYKEVVLPSAFTRDLPTFLAERHLFAANHRYVNDAGEPTIIGKVTAASVDDKGLLTTFQFDTDSLSEKWFQKYLSKTLNAFSIGFIPVAWKDEKEKDQPDADVVRTYTEVELLEISAVPIPANRESIVTNSVELAAQCMDTFKAKLDAQAEQITALQTELTKAIHGLRNDVLGQVGVALARVASCAGIADDGRTARGGADARSPMTRLLEEKKKQHERGNDNA